MSRRIVSIWFPRLVSEQALRRQPCDAPFVLTHLEKNAERVFCLNEIAEADGVSRGMSFADARAICPDLVSRHADTDEVAGFLRMLARWAERYCPWVSVDGTDGLLLDVSGSAHLVGGEHALLEDIQGRLSRAGLTVRIGLADTVGAAWAMARYAPGIVATGSTKVALGPLSVAALRLSTADCTGLGRLGVRTIGQMMDLPRPTLARRFGASVMLQLDRALGNVAEPVSPAKLMPNYAIRLTLPEPIGLVGDVMAALERLLARLCTHLEQNGAGARRLRLTGQRVDQSNVIAEIGLARPMRDADRMLALFERAVQEIDSGFGIDRLRLQAVEVEPLPFHQLSHSAPTGKTESTALSDLITRLGNRVGFDNVLRHLPAESHVPEKSYLIASAAYSEPAPNGWFHAPRRPLLIFPPEGIAGYQRRPPERFRWRRMSFTTARADGPERLQPEWWLVDPAWRSGMRDYWWVQTVEGRRLWLFFTPQNPSWFVQGEFA